MSKKKKILLVVAILSCIIVAFIGGQSFSKYVAEVRGNGTAEVATWSFKVNGQEEQVETIQLWSTCDDDTLLDHKIAPGTYGSFNVMIDGTGSDVGINYDIKFENENGKPANLKFVYNNLEYNSTEELSKDLSGTIYANDETKTKVLTIGWKWDYETGATESEIANNDKIDTQDAKDIANYTFDIVVSGNQVMPTT